MQDTSMVVRIRGNIDELKKSLADGKAVIDGVSVSMSQASRKGSRELHESFQQIDKVLASLGINVGTNVAALDELASASGKTASQIGGIATAGLVAASAFAGWNIGRKVAEFFDLDKAIGKATASLFGFGDVAAQEAGAKADVLARATKNAGYEVTNMAEAMRINEAAARGMIATNIKNSDTLKQLAVDAKHSADVMEANRLKLLKVEHDYAVALRETAGANKAAYDQMAADSAARTAKAGSDVKTALEQEAEGANSFGRAMQEADIASQAAQAKAIEDAQKATIALMDQKAAADALAKSMTSSITYDLSTDEGMDEFKRLNPSAYIGNIPPGYFKTHTLQDAIRDGLIDLWAGFRDRRYGTGGRDISEGPALVGEHGPEIVHLREGSSVIPNNQIGGLGGLTVNVHVQGGSTDGAAQGRAAAEGLIARMKQLGVRLPVNVT